MKISAGRWKRNFSKHSSILRRRIPPAFLLFGEDVGKIEMSIRAFWQDWQAKYGEISEFKDNWNSRMYDNRAAESEQHCGTSTYKLRSILGII